MKLSEFILLDEKEKTQVLMCEGILVAKQKKAPMIRFLFQMDHYYVDMCCDSRRKEVKEFNAFTDTKQLQPFLDQIPLNGLV